VRDVQPAGARRRVDALRRADRRRPCPPHAYPTGRIRPQLVAAPELIQWNPKETEMRKTLILGAAVIALAGGGCAKRQPPPAEVPPAEQGGPGGEGGARGGGERTGV